MKKTAMYMAVIWLFVIVYPSLASANICIELPSFPADNYKFDDDIVISSFDGTQIAANLFTPLNSQQGAAPAIIFVNSWVLDEHEYLIQARQFAEKGYLVLSYSARGWGCSGGQVNVAGENDMADLSAVLDWLVANTEVDPDNIGISGISYGSGISLMGLAHDARIKTAVAMSTWGSLTESLYQHETPRMFWGFLLVSSGWITASLEPAISQNYANLIFHHNIASTLEWAEQRSASNVVNLINERNAPVYLANNFGDNLFQPNNIVKLFQNLTVPKRLDLNQGTHASAEGFGLIGLENYTWSNTHRWFDYWLKGEQTGIMDDPSVTMEVSRTKQRHEFSQWPSVLNPEQTFFLEARGLFTNGKLRRSPYRPWWSKTNRIYSGLDTLATTGIPLVSEILDAHLNIPVKTPVNLISRANGIVFKSSPVTRTLKIRGIPELSVFMQPTSGQFQINAYLYDLAPNGVGTLITHGPMTQYQAPAHQTIRADWEMVATAYDVPAGHKIAIAFDTVDPLYAVPTILPYSVAFKFKSGDDSVLRLPVVD